MKNSPDNFQLEQQKMQPRESGLPDLVDLLPLLVKKWYWFVLAIATALLCALFYIGHTLPVFRSTTTVLINETEDRPLVDNTELLQGLGLPGGMRNLQNQIMILKSRTLIESTLKLLPFEVEYYFKTIKNSLPIYPENPITIVSENEIPLPRDTEFLISYLGNNMFNLKSEGKNFLFEKTASFGETIEIRGGSFQIECQNVEWFNMHGEEKLYFIIHSRVRLISSFSKRIEIEQVSREGSILRVSMEGTNRVKDADFLNKLIEEFQAISLERKNLEAIRRIQFIDDQLVGISDSLNITENKLQQFRSSHRVMDLSVQGQSIIGQVTILENEKARLNLDANYYDYLADYLAKDATGEVPIIPITMGISDPALTRIVEELAVLQGQLATAGAGEKNPLQRNLEQRVRSSKEALKETLNGLKRANSLARSENQEQINKANAQASALPVTERQLLGIERKFRLNDELYTFLLEIRSEQEMQKASNRSDSEVVEAADSHFSMLVSPNKALVNLVAAFLGFGVPLLIIVLINVFNKKLKDDDINKITDIPIVGNIPHNAEKLNTIVFDYPNSSIAESFRLLRSKMQFFTKGAKAPVILVTSTMPGDGKTFASINLASVCSLLGKKTVLVGFDLRKPKIYQDFNLENEKGVSTWLIGKDNIQDIIQKTTYDNLWVISSGPIPPNPSELTALEKTHELLEQLKERFDYIIIDSSPIGIVSDTYYLASKADACLIIVRPAHTLRDLFEHTLNEVNASGTKGISLVINDIKADSKRYGYGDKYGYTSDKEKTLKSSNKSRQPK